MTMKIPDSLRLTMLLMGGFLILLGIFLNYQLYTSIAGDNIIHKLGYGSVGIGLDVSKVICLSLGTILLLMGSFPLKIVGTASILVYLPLAYLSLNAGWGFALIITQQYEAEIFQKNAQVQAQQASVSTAKENVKKLSVYANKNVADLAQVKANQLQQKLEALWASAALNSLNQRTGKTVKAQLSRCPGNSWYHGKYCSKIGAIQTSIATQQAAIKNHADYLAAQKHESFEVKKLAEMDLSKLDPNSYIHPLFIGLAARFNVSPQTAKYNLLYFSALAIEFLGAFFFVIGLLVKNKQTFTWEDILEAENIKQKMLEQFSAKNITPPQMALKISPKVNPEENVTFSSESEMALKVNPKVDTKVNPGENITLPAKWEELKEAFHQKTLSPNVSSVKAFLRCSPANAMKYLAKLSKEGILSQKHSNGRYYYAS